MLDRAPRIHPTAIVDPGAALGAEVTVGPLAVIGAGVELGEGCRVDARATLLGPTRLGPRCVVGVGAVLGAEPQARAYRGEPTRLEIGEETVVHEHVTAHRGTIAGGGVTRIGARCRLMVGAHVAHDCAVGDDVTFANLVTLAGHVRVGDRCSFAGLAAVAPFVEIGRAVYLAGGTAVERNVPPFVIAGGHRARVRAPNPIGLRRAGAPEASVRAVERAFRLVWRRGATIAEGARAAREELGRDAWVAELLDAIDRGFEPRRPVVAT